jgi:hypothetical protein
LDFVRLNLKLVPFGQVTEETPRYEDVLAETPDEQEQQEFDGGSQEGH